MTPRSSRLPKPLPSLHNPAMPSGPIIKEEELEEIFERSSGPGGQNVNKTSTKVILRHIPTGTTVTVQDSRSQFKNRQIARERLVEAIRSAREKAEAARRSAAEKARRRNSPRPAKVKRRMLQSKRQRAEKRANRRIDSD